VNELQVHFHNEKTEFVGEHVVRLPRDSCVGDVLQELSSRLGQEYAGRQLRLLEVYQSKIYKVRGGRLWSTLSNAVCAAAEAAGGIPQSHSRGVVCCSGWRRTTVAITQQIYHRYVRRSLDLRLMCVGCSGVCRAAAEAAGGVAQHNLQGAWQELCSVGSRLRNVAAQTAALN
jgi:hypothetical protein